MDRSDALCIGIRDMLRTEYPFRKEYCENRPGGSYSGRPPANSGQYYVAVFPGGIAPGPSPDQQLGVDEIHSVSIGITQRTAVATEDRFFEEAIFHKEEGAYTIFQRIARLMRTKRGKYDILNPINVAMSTDGVRGAFIEPLDFVADTYQFVVKQPDWFLSEDIAPDDPGFCQDYGIYVEMQYTGARYWESLLPDAAGIWP